MPTPLAAQPPAISVPATLPPHRRAAFVAQAAGRLRMGLAQGMSEAQILPLLAAEQEAIADGIAMQSVLDVAADQYTQAINMRVAPELAIGREDGVRALQSILLNRIQDAQTFAALLLDPNFATELRVEAAKPAPPPKDPRVLPPHKHTEVTERLVQERDPRGPEPAVHVQHAAIGQRLGHLALAQVFEPNGPLLAPLAQAIAQHLPPALAAEAPRIATDWLAARQGPAFAVADEHAINGAAYTEAMARAEQLQQQKLGLAPVSHLDRAKQSRGGFLAERV